MSSTFPRILLRVLGIIVTCSSRCCRSGGVGSAESGGNEVDQVLYEKVEFTKFSGKSFGIFNFFIIKCFYSQFIHYLIEGNFRIDEKVGK